MSKAPFNIREVRDIAAWRVHGTAKGRKVVQELDAEARGVRSARFLDESRTSATLHNLVLILT